MTSPFAFEGGSLLLAHVSMGGPVDRLWQKAKAAGRVSVVVPPNFWAVVAAASPSFEVLVRSRLENLECEVELISQLPLSTSEETRWRKLREFSFRVEADLREPTLFDWSQEIFASSLRQAGEITWRRELQAYEKQIEAVYASMDALRFLPGFLKSRGLAFALAAALDWARADALYSPQDDRRREGEWLALNPTLQTVNTTTMVIAIWRTDGHLSERELSWPEAAVIDELRETPRLTTPQLESHLTAKPYPFKAPANFPATIANLKAEGLLL